MSYNDMILAQSAGGVVEHTDCISAEGVPPNSANECPRSDT